LRTELSFDWTTETHACLATILMQFKESNLLRKPYIDCLAPVHSTSTSNVQTELWIIRANTPTALSCLSVQEYHMQSCSLHPPKFKNGHNFYIYWNA